MKLSYINLSLILIIIFFIILNTVDTPVSGGTYRSSTTYSDNSGWKAGEGKKGNLNGPPPYTKGEIPDGGNAAISGCFVTFIGIPVTLLILYLIFIYLKNTGTHTSDTTYYYDEDGKIDRMSEE